MVPSMQTQTEKAFRSPRVEGRGVVEGSLACGECKRNFVLGAWNLLLLAGNPEENRAKDDDNMD